jgi:ABC-type antimicrobial peptide transport system permease subunit
MSLVVRTTLDDPSTIFPAVRAAVAEIDAAIPLANAEPMSAIVDRSMGRLTFTTSLLVLASVLALVLAAVGLYGVIAFVVARRTREMGIRLALGAQPRQIASLVVAGSFRVVAVGLFAGSLAALMLSRLLRGILFGVAPTDPVIYAVAIAVIAMVGMLASWLPARRAALADPMSAMRIE